MVSVSLTAASRRRAHGGARGGAEGAEGLSWAQLKAVEESGEDGRDIPGPFPGPSHRPCEPAARGPAAGHLPGEPEAYRRFWKGLGGEACASERVCGFCWERPLCGPSCVPHMHMLKG